MLRLVSVAAMIMGVNAHVFQPVDSEFLEVTTRPDAPTTPPASSTPPSSGEGDTSKPVGVVWTN